MRRAARVLPLLALLLTPGGAWAEDGAYGLFIAGQTAGEPTTPKVVTTVSLYGASVLSLGAGVYFLVDWNRLERDRDAFNGAQPNACATFSSEACGRASSIDQDANRALTLGLGAVATSVTLGVSGLLLAELWPNAPVSPQAALLPDGGVLGANLRF